MNFEEFKLERYFAKYEFSAKYLMSSSDCESLKLKELLDLSDNQCLELWNNMHLGYTESKGHPLLIEEIAKLYKGLTKENILVTVPQEGVFITLSSILVKNDHVIIMKPAYQSLSEIPRALGCSISEWPLKIENNNWTLDFELLEKLITKETKLLIINFPHNPTGYLPSKSEFEKTIEICRKYGIYIFSDEMYRLSEYKEEDRLEAVGSYYEKGISLSGLSKTFGLPGLRVGWLASKNKDLISKFLIKKDYTTICGCAPGEILAIIALRAKDKIIKRNLDIIRNNLKDIEIFLSKYSRYFNWIAPKAGSVAFTEFVKDFPIDRFCEELVNRKSIMILPSTVFDFSGNFFRVGLGRKNLQVVLEKLDEYMKEFF